MTARAFEERFRKCFRQDLPPPLPRTVTAFVYSGSLKKRRAPPLPAHPKPEGAAAAIANFASSVLHVLAASSAAPRIQEAKGNDKRTVEDPAARECDKHENLYEEVVDPLPDLEKAGRRPQVRKGGMVSAPVKPYNESNTEEEVEVLEVRRRDPTEGQTKVDSREPGLRGQYYFGEEPKTFPAVLPKTATAVLSSAPITENGTEGSLKQMSPMKSKLPKKSTLVRPSFSMSVQTRHSIFRWSARHKKSPVSHSPRSKLNRRPKVSMKASLTLFDSEKVSKDKERRPEEIEDDLALPTVVADASRPPSRLRYVSPPRAPSQPPVCIRVTDSPLPARSQVLPAPENEVIDISSPPKSSRLLTSHAAPALHPPRPRSAALGSYGLEPASSAPPRPHSAPHGSSRPHSPTRGSSRPHSPTRGSSRPHSPTRGSSRPQKPTRGSSRPQKPTRGSSRPLSPSRGSSRPHSSTKGSSRPHNP